MTGVEYPSSGLMTVEKTFFTDEHPDYRYDDKQEFRKISEWFSDRIESQIDENRLMPDFESVLGTAVRIGLCFLEYSDRDARYLVRETWMKTGNEEKIKEEIIESFTEEISSYKLEENLRRLDAGKLLEIDRTLKGRK